MHVDALAKQGIGGIGIGSTFEWGVSLKITPRPAWDSYLELK